MKNQPFSSWSAVLLALLFGASCAGSDFAGTSGRKKDAEKADDDKNSTDSGDSDGGTGDADGDGTDDGAGGVDGGDDTGDADGTGGDDDAAGDDGSIGSDADIAALGEIDITTSDGVVKAAKCSDDYSVPGSSNPYLAGVPDGTSIVYEDATDTMPAQKPLLVVPKVGKCIKEGNRLYFEVSGTISHGASAPTNADGRMDNIQNHEKSGWLGKGNINAPLNALVGVFLGDADPSALPAPTGLTFGSQAERDYAKLEPLVGQVFFIGDGKSTDGKFQEVLVPVGAKRLFFGIMDSFEWNNNSGQLTGAILIKK